MDVKEYNKLKQQPSKASNNKINEAYKNLKIDSLKKLLNTHVEAEYRFHHDRKWRFDYYIPMHRVAIEVEGGIWTGGRHVRGKGFTNDIEKYNEATSLGILVLRFAPNDLLKPSTIEKIKTAMALDLEIWKDLKNFENKYKISNRGNIFSKIQNRYLKLCINKYGYVTASINHARGCDKNLYIHRLVADTFLGGIPEGMVINHKDGIKANNHVSNLEIVTSSDNNRHAYEQLGKQIGGCCIPKNKPAVINPVIQLDLNGNFVAEFDNPFKASKATGTRYEGILAVCKGTNVTAGKHKWLYKKDYTRYQESTLITG